MWERLEKREIARRALSPGPGDRPRRDRPVGSDLIPEIKHIIVLMMENHSYDNYLGMLSGRGDGFRLGADGRPTASNPNEDGKMIRARRAPSTDQVDGVPCQSWHASHQQWAEGRMDGFVTSSQEVDPGVDETAGMAYWNEQDLPFY